MTGHATCVPVQLQKEPRVSIVVVMANARRHVIRGHVLQLNVNVIQVGQDPNAKFLVSLRDQLGAYSIWPFFVLTIVTNC